MQSYDERLSALPRLVWLWFKVEDMLPLVIGKCRHVNAFVLDLNRSMNLQVVRPIHGRQQQCTDTVSPVQRICGEELRSNCNAKRTSSERSHQQKNTVRILTSEKFIHFLVLLFHNQGHGPSRLHHGGQGNLPRPNWQPLSPQTTTLNQRLEVTTLSRSLPHTRHRLRPIVTHIRYRIITKQTKKTPRIPPQTNKTIHELNPHTHLYTS